MPRALRRPLHGRHGPVGTYVGVVAPELIKQVFTADPDALRAGEANEILEPIVGRNSVLLLDGPRHIRQRRLLLPPLHGERMQTYSRIMADATRARGDGGGLDLGALPRLEYLDAVVRESLRLRRFLPERFVGAKVDPYAWLPFGGGVRRCVGMAFALHEMKVVLAEMWLRARLRLETPGPVKTVRRTITMAPSGGTRVVLTERRRPARRPEATA